MIKKIELPNLTDDAAYAAAKAKLTELQAEVSKATARRNEVLGLLNDAAQNPSSRLSLITQKAYQLLGGDSTSPDANTSALRAELAALSETVAVHTEAVRIQREAVEKLHAQASKHVIAEALPHHKQMVREIIKQITALDTALEAERELRQGLVDAGVYLGEVRPMNLPGFGRIADVNSRAAQYLIETCEYGYISVNDLPENLRPLARAKLHRDAPVVPMRAKVDPDGWQAAA